MAVKASIYVRLCAVYIAAILTLAKGTPLRNDSSTQDASESVNQGFLFNGLFEGDLKLTEEEISRQYGISAGGQELVVNGSPDAGYDGTRTSSRHPRAATSDSGGNLWPNAVIRYEIDPNVPIDLVDTIYTAMEEWEDETCLRFLPRRSSLDFDYVYFTTENVCDGDIGACCSDSVGRKGGEQKVSLHAAYCNHEGTILHLIGHVIGFWHEESRPDRDNFISINYNNIQPGAHDQFLKRNDLDVDYQGVGYDYGSIMHLPMTVFTCCPFPFPHRTMEITNYAEYAYQGNPPIGHLGYISNMDSEQVCRLYNCPGSGVVGVLRINVISGQNFPVSDEDVYVKVTAVDRHGDLVVRRTNVQMSTVKPKWNQELDFGEREWQFFRIRVYGEDPGNDDAISMSETVVIKGNAYWYRDHCLTTQCTASVRYLYEFVVNGGECSSHPCDNGGACYESTGSNDGFPTYTCVCQPGWTGNDCGVRLACSSNPCRNGGTCYERINHESGTSTHICSCPPSWSGSNCDQTSACYNSHLCQHGGTCYSVTDQYAGSTIPLCRCSPGWGGDNCNIELPCYSSPCQNGGTCTNIVTNYDTGTSTYACSCPPSSIGTNCQDKCPCQNGGTCSQPATINNYLCECLYGHYGINCQYGFVIH